MCWNIARVSGCLVMLSAAPLMAQDFDPALGVEAVSVLEDGRVLVRNGETAFGCDLVPKAGTVKLDDCVVRLPLDGEAAVLLFALSEQDWRAAVRDTLLDAQCRLSAFTAIGEVLAATAVANGVAPETIGGARAALSARAEAAVAQMLREGELSYRDGELALDACP